MYIILSEIYKYFYSLLIESNNLKVVSSLESLYILPKIIKYLKSYINNYYNGTIFTKRSGFICS